MIRFDDVSLRYSGSESAVLEDLSLSIEEGMLCLVAGGTGSGKTSLLGMINGLVPHFTGGTVSGSVVVGSRDLSTTRPGEMADLVGYVGQDPARGFVAETVEYELAYGMEQAGLAPELMRVRVEEALDLLGIAHLRDRRLSELSGGEQQRVAIGAVMTTHPRILVLDEPTSSLDPGAAEDVLATLTRLVHDLGLTVVVAEHRLERIVQYADQVVIVANGTASSGDPRLMMKESPIAPPVVDLARHFGWDPIPLTIRDTRSMARDLELRAIARSPRPEMAAVVSASGVTLTYGPTVALNDLSIRLEAGAVCAVMGRNGAGKSSLFWTLQGAVDPGRGSVDRRGVVSLVPQTPSDLLFLPTVDEECRQSDEDARKESGACKKLLAELSPGIDGSLHPSDLSEGQRLALVLATQLVGEPDVILLDEPTRGLDYAAKSRLAEMLSGLAQKGKAVAVTTHDVEFAAGVADRVVVMAQGEIVSDGDAADVLTGTPLFSPQIAKVFAPHTVLTVDDVVGAMR